MRQQIGPVRRQFLLIGALAGLVLVGWGWWASQAASPRPGGVGFVQVDVPCDCPTNP